MRYHQVKAIGLAVFALLILSFITVQAQTQLETLNQYVNELQKNPNDNVLREKIIKHVQAMKPALGIPEEARRHYVKALTLLENAKQPSDSADASEEFRQALLIAPWWGEAYMKMGLALETAQRYDDAMMSLKLFIFTNPNEDVLRKAQDEIYKIEARAQIAAKDKELATKKAIEDKRAQQEDWLKKLDGARYSYSFLDDDGTTIIWAMEIIGKKLVQTTNSFAHRQWAEWQRIEITDREFVRNTAYEKVTYRITDQAITVTTQNAKGEVVLTQVYKRER